LRTTIRFKFNSLTKSIAKQHVANGTDNYQPTEEEAKECWKKLLKRTTHTWREVKEQAMDHLQHDVNNWINVLQNNNNITVTEAVEKHNQVFQILKLYRPQPV